MGRKIALAGKSGSGKGEISKFLVSKGYSEIAIANSIRLELQAYLENSLTYFAPITEHPNLDNLVFPILRDSLWKKPTSELSRVLFQWWGDYKRSLDPGYWLTPISPYLTISSGSYVFSDVRLTIELETIKKFNGECWLIENPNNDNEVGIPGHITENGWEGFEFDRVISNDGTIEDLIVKVEKFL